MVEPILQKIKLGRLPLQRRPMAEPGTTLVYQLADDRYDAPEHPYTTGEILWKGLKFAYLVDVRTHGASFTCKLPAAGDALFFDATVNYSWSVNDPVTVVRQQVTGPEAECQAYLLQRLPNLTRRHDFVDPAKAEADVQQTLGRFPMELPGRGLRVSGLYAHLRIDAEQLTTVRQLQSHGLKQELGEKEAVGAGSIALLKEQQELQRQAMRQQQMSEIVASPERLRAFVLQQDPTTGMELLGRMEAMSEREELRTIESIKVLIEGGELRLGELDGVVATAVERFQAIIGKTAGLAAATDPSRTLPAGEDSAPSATADNTTSPAPDVGEED